MLITTKFRAPVGIRDLIIAETPLYCVIHYVKSTGGSPANPGIVNEYCLNIADNNLYRYNGSMWTSQSISITDRFVFCKNGTNPIGCGNNIADMTIYYISGAEYINKFAVDGIVVLVKNSSNGYKDNSLIAYDKIDNEWVVNEASDINTASGVMFWLDPVISKSISSPPSSPNVNDRYIVPVGATGIWSGQDEKVAEWDSSQWIYTNEFKGLVSYVNDEDKIYTCDGTTWLLLSGSGSSDHAMLSNLQGGTSSEYYHLTNSEHNTITGSKSNNLILASPDGIAGNPTFRSLTETDLPPIDGGTWA